MTEFDGSIGSILANLFSDSGGNRFFITSIVVTMFIFSYTTADLFMNNREIVEYTLKEKEWKIYFDMQTETLEHTEIWKDEETKVIQFHMDDVEILEGYRIGMINVSILPDADSSGGILDPLNQCDSIGANIIKRTGEEDGLFAQWEDQRNVLSGQDSSCQIIDLFLSVYPNFDGENVTYEAANEFQALQQWREDNWGHGVLEIEVDLDVNTVEPGPFATDDEEEITIVVEVHTFFATANLIN